MSTQENEKKLDALDVTTEFQFDDDVPARENTHTMRHIAEGIPIAACFILVNEFWYESTHTILYN